MSTVEEPWACGECLSRAWLLAHLAPYIEKAATRAPGRRAAEILRLSDDDLILAVAPHHRTEIADARARVGEAEMRRAMEGSDSWGVCRHSEDFPAGLADLGDGPAALFGRGDAALLAELSPERTVTMVGARRATVYGLGVARELGRELALAGLTVVSGLALGIDGAAHTGALETGLSCAVLGCGVDLAYPARHRSLYDRHLDRGLVLSELPVGTTAWKWTFPARNRVMAGLAGMTVVVEANERSGSLITATMAQEIGRDLGAVPGPVTASASAGANALIGQGACLVRCAQDVLDAMLIDSSVRSPTGPRLDPDLAAALESFERCGGEPEQVHGALDRQGIDPHSALARLELLGYLQCTGLGVWTRTTQPAPSAGRSDPDGPRRPREPGDRLWGR